MHTVNAMHSLAAFAPSAPDPYLYDVTFAVLDVETTGGSPDEAALLEVGAAAYRGGQELDRFEALVNPGTEIPPFVSELTGITDDMVRSAPSPALVLPRLV